MGAPATTTISGWGRHPAIASFTRLVRSRVEAAAAVTTGFQGIPRGLGRSYGDSALAEQVLDLRPMDHLLELDADRGVLRCEAGASLAAVLEVIVPRGWFLPVTPGTKFVTVGGAIASDVHGKNHHVDGTFCDHVERLTLMIADGSTVVCSPSERPDLFRATCGGMGLTGVILDATIRLKRIASSSIDETIHKARGLDEALDLFDEHAKATYSVAWIDCLTTGSGLGRSLLMTGEHHPTGPLTAGRKAKLAVPIDAPDFVLSPLSIRLFNTLHYHRVRRDVTRRIVHYDGFFYPLDGIHDWNRLYGKRGFTQYQFVIPKEAGRSGMRAILERITASRRGSFLAVLKAFGPANANLLSFPMAGYTLALDFKIDDGLFPLLDELDRIVLDHGGRLYLTKDARMSGETFRRGYPKLEEFLAIRRQVGAEGVFRSLQSDRLGIS